MSSEPPPLERYKPEREQLPEYMSDEDPDEEIQKTYKKYFEFERMCEHDKSEESDEDDRNEKYQEVRLNRGGLLEHTRIRYTMLRTVRAYNRRIRLLQRVLSLLDMSISDRINALYRTHQSRVMIDVYGMFTDESSLRTDIPNFKRERRFIIDEMVVKKKVLELMEKTILMCFQYQSKLDQLVRDAMRSEKI
jgi:hypothetical protein